MGASAFRLILTPDKGRLIGVACTSLYRGGSGVTIP